MTEGRWRISVTAPDWGQGHLSLDAIVAYADDELAHGPHLRATQHLAQCRECAAQVVVQAQARSALRTAGGPSLPTSLLSSLRSIPQDAELPPPADFAVTADGQFVSVLRPERLAPLPAEPLPAEPSRSAGQADLVAAPPAGTDHGDHHDGHHGSRAHRRRRLGTGVAVSGLALGAIALAMPAAVAPQTPVPAATNGVLGGSVLGGSGLGGTTASVVDAQLRLPATSRPSRTTGPARGPVLDPLDAMPGSFYGLP